jgi:hypothetical protein
VGVFYAASTVVTEDQQKDSVDLIAAFAERGKHVQFEDAHGNVVVIAQNTIQNSVFVLEALEA